MRKWQNQEKTLEVMPFIRESVREKTRGIPFPIRTGNTNEFYKSGNYEGLEKIYDYLMNPRPRRTASSRKVVSADNMKSFFAGKGLEVIDKRSKGGALWVVGTPEEINSIVREACRMFQAGGNYVMNGGRSTGYRTAWFTHCTR